MNARPDIETDFGALAREYWRCLGKADRLRWLDDRLLEIGPTMPVPEFTTISEDARLWADSNLAEVLKVYLAAIWLTLSERDQAGFLRWVEKQKDPK